MRRQAAYVHESFDPDDPARFSRPWFAWANTPFDELVFRLRAERPAILQETA